MASIFNPTYKREVWCHVFVPYGPDTAPWFRRKYMTITCNHEADAIRAVTKHLGHDMPVYTCLDCDIDRSTGKQCYKMFTPPYACICCRRITLPNGEKASYRVLRHFRIDDTTRAVPSFFPTAEAYAAKDHEELVEYYNGLYIGVEKFKTITMIEAKGYPIGTCLVDDITDFDMRKMGIDGF